jgi:hypothetical protein
VPARSEVSTARAKKAAPPVNEEPEEEKESEEEEEPDGPREETPAPMMENAGAASATLLSDVLRTNGERVDLTWCGAHNHMWKSLSSLKKKTASQQACVVCALKKKGGWKVKRAFNGTQFCVNCSRPEFNHYFVACSVIHEGEEHSCQFLSHLVVVD